LRFVGGVQPPPRPMVLTGGRGFRMRAGTARWVAGCAAAGSVALTGGELVLAYADRHLVPGGPQPPLEPLRNSEIRVLRYLPTNLSGPEIANELSISPNTVKTHIHNLYAKLGTHRRGDAVACARALGLLAPSAPRR
jgi:DNA-binding NarL/FixJ family response regulator